jgi:hypothetical protein
MHNFWEAPMAPASTTTATKSKYAKTKKKRTKHTSKGREANIQEGAIEPPVAVEPPVAAGSVACDNASIDLQTGIETDGHNALAAGSGHNATVTPCAASRTSDVVQLTVAESQSYVSQKNQLAFDEKCKNWCDVIIRMVGRQFFNGIQFITSAEDEKYGSPFQQLVCKRAGVDPNVAEEFWNRRVDGGMMNARASLNRRRMNTTNAMKKKFLGK